MVFILAGTWLALRTMPSAACHCVISYRGVQACCAPRIKWLGTVWGDHHLYTKNGSFGQNGNLPVGMWYPGSPTSKHSFQVKVAVFGERDH